MRSFWSLFWKLLGAAMLLMFVISIIWGIVKSSADAAYTMIKQTLTAGFGICGIIAFIVVPVELFFEDRKKRKTDHDVM